MTQSNPLRLLDNICNLVLSNKPIRIQQQTLTVKSILFCEEQIGYSVKLLAGAKIYNIINNLDREEFKVLQDYLVNKPRVAINTMSLNMYQGQVSEEKVITVLTDIHDPDDATIGELKKQQHALNMYTVHTLYNLEGSFVQEKLSQEKSEIIKYSYILRNTYQGRFNDILDYSSLVLELKGYHEGLISNEAVYSPNFDNRTTLLCKTVDLRAMHKNDMGYSKILASVASYSLEKTGVRVYTRGSFDTVCSIKITGIFSFLKCVSENHMSFIKSQTSGLVILRDAVPDDILDVFYNATTTSNTDLIAGYYFNTTPLICNNPAIKITTVTVKDKMGNITHENWIDSYNKLLLMSSEFNFIIIPEDTILTPYQILCLAERTKVYWLLQFKDLSYICDLIPEQSLNNFSQSFLYAGSSRGDEGIINHPTLRTMIVNQEYNKLRSVSLSRYFSVRNTSTNPPKNLKIEYISLFPFLLSENPEADSIVLDKNITLNFKGVFKKSSYSPIDVDCGVMLRIFQELDINKDIYDTLSKYGTVIFTTQLPYNNITSTYRIKIVQISTNQVTGIGYKIIVEHINKNKEGLIDYAIRPGFTILGGDEPSKLLKGLIPKIANKDILLIDMPHDIIEDDFDASITSIVTYHGRLNKRIEELLFFKPSVVIINTAEYYDMKEIFGYIQKYCDYRTQSIIITTKDTYDLLELHSKIEDIIRNLNLIANQLKVKKLPLADDKYIYIREFFTQENILRSSTSIKSASNLKNITMGQGGNILSELKGLVAKHEIDEAEFVRYSTKNSNDSTTTSRNMLLSK